MDSPFSNKTVCLDLKDTTRYKEKKRLIELLTSNGAKVSFIIQKGSSLLIKNDKSNVSTYKCRTAFKLGIPVVHVDYIFNLLNKKVVNFKDYVIVNTESQQRFKNGKIVGNIQKIIIILINLKFYFN